MGIFTRIKNVMAPDSAPVESADAVKPAKKEKAKAVTEKETNAAAATTAVPVLLSSPRVSEKASVLTSAGTYVFNVPLGTNKVQVRKAVETHYKVKVERVNMIRGEGKIVRRGRVHGRRSDWKKALVTLKKGEKIELHSGV